MSGFNLNSIVLPLPKAALASVVFLLLLLATCDKNRIYEKNITIEKYLWDSAEKPEFILEVKDTSVLYNLYVNIRHAEIYPYRNLWLLITTRFPDGTSASRRIEVMLANEEGKWFGEGLGDLWDYRTLIQENAYFSQPGTYTFSFEQNMRRDPLPAIMSVGLRVENTGLRRSSAPQ
jgi:gliding motility-associated lipoprotein GldH